MTTGLLWSSRAAARLEMKRPSGSSGAARKAKARAKAKAEADAKAEAKAKAEAEAKAKADAEAELRSWQNRAQAAEREVAELKVEGRIRVGPVSFDCAASRRGSKPSAHSCARAPCRRSWRRRSAARAWRCRQCRGAGTKAPPRGGALHNTTHTHTRKRTKGPPQHAHTHTHTHQRPVARIAGCGVV